MLTKLVNDKLINNKLQEVINYFQLGEGYDNHEIITDILGEIKELKNCSADEIGLEWDKEHLMILDDFVNEFYNLIIKNVCNVLKSFKDNK